MDFFYVFLWGLIFVLSLLNFAGVIKYNKHLLNCLLLIWAFFVGFRSEIGQDWTNYVEFFNTGIAPDKTSGVYEPVFNAARWIIYNLGFRYEVFFFVLSLFSLYLIKICSVKLGVKNIYMVFLVYISMFFCFYQFNIVRSGIMASCLWMSFVYRKENKNKMSLLWCLIAAGFHVVALMFLPIIWLANKQYKFGWVVGLLSVGYIVMAFHIGDFISSLFPILGTIDRVSEYLDPSNLRERGLTLGAVFNLSLLLYLYFTKKIKYESEANFRLVINILIWGLFITSFFNSIGMIATRVGQVLNMSLIFIWPFFISSLKNKGVAFSLFIIMTVYLLLFYTKAFRPDEILGFSSIYPYQMEFNGIFR